MKRYQLVFLLVVAFLCLLAQAYADDYHIKSGDTIGVTVLGEQELTKHLVVDPKGNISMPLIGELPVADLTLRQTADLLTKQLEKFVKGPQVSVELVESAKMQVTISGDVKTPGVYALPSGSKLMDLITTAGSYTQAADLTHVQISHSGTESITVDLSAFLLSGDMTKNLPVNNGDTVFVPAKETESIGTVTVLGAVRQSGQHPIVKGMTVREAIMLAGGPTELADLTKVTVRHAGTSESLPVDYISASSGLPTTNPELKPGDVVYVTPKETLGYYTIYGGVGTPGRYELKGNTTLTEAIAMAGGAKDVAKLNNVRILRNSGGTPTTLNANVSNIMNGKAANLPVRDQDSIYVDQKQGPSTNYLQYISVGVSLAWLLLKR